MYFNVNFNVFFKLIKVHLLVSELYTYIRLHGANDNKTQKNIFVLIVKCTALQAFIDIQVITHSETPNMASSS